MIERFILSLLLLGTAVASDWPQWRGPQKDNHAAPDAVPVTEWSETQNVRWKTPVPGRGHSTPIIVNGRIYLSTGDAEKKTQSLLALDRQSGEILWETVIHQGGFPENLHRDNSPASASPQWDGTNILVVFENEQKIKTTAVNPDGKIVWSQSLGDYLPHHPFGFGSTPVLHQNSLIVAIGTQENGRLVSLDIKDGQTQWTTPREGFDFWAAPVIAKVAGRNQLLISGVNKISSYHPDTGKLLWEAPGGAKSMCGTIIWHEDLVFASGGFPESETIAVKADGSGEVAWKTPVKCYEQSLLSSHGLIFAVADNGRGYCWDPRTGQEHWSERIGRGGVMASPLAVGDLIYASLKNGTTVIFKAQSKGFELVAENKLGDDTFASPVVVQNDLFLRVGHLDRGNRQEVLYCIAK